MAISVPAQRPAFPSPPPTSCPWPRPRTGSMRDPDGGSLRGSPSSGPAPLLPGPPHFSSASSVPCASAPQGPWGGGPERAAGIPPTGPHTSDSLSGVLPPANCQHGVCTHFSAGIPGFLCWRSASHVAHVTSRLVSDTEGSSAWSPAHSLVSLIWMQPCFPGCLPALR